MKCWRADLLAYRVRGCLSRANISPASALQRVSHSSAEEERTRLAGLATIAQPLANANNARLSASPDATFVPIPWFAKARKQSDTSGDCCVCSLQIIMQPANRLPPIEHRRLEHLRNSQLLARLLLVIGSILAISHAFALALFHSPRSCSHSPSGDSSGPPQGRSERESVPWARVRALH